MSVVPHSNVDATPILCDFTPAGHWNAGDVLKIEYWGRWQSNLGVPVALSLWAEVSLDGGGTWKKIRPSVNGGRDTTEADSTWNCAGSSSIACATAPQVRLGCLAFPGNPNSDYNFGEGYLIRCTRYPASIYTQGPVGTLV